ncbi:putative serine protein kinase PrkA [Salinisphaera sp. PC39]
MRGAAVSRRIRGRAAGIAATLLLACAPWAQADPGYDYPLEDPLAATVVGTPEEFRAALPENLPLALRELPPPVERPTPEVLGYARPLHYGLAAQDGPAPLAYVIAGTGGDALGANNRLLARILHDAGFHVVTLPSPTTVTFMLNAATHPVPGRMSADVADLYRLMRLVDARVSAELDIEGRYLTGYSLGATQAAFVARHDETAGAFGFRRVLLVNPAVDVYGSVRRLDALLLEGLPQGIADLPVFLERTMAQLKRLYGEGDPLRFETDVLYRAYLRARPDRDNLAGMVGLAFRLALANMAFAADLITDSGVILPAGSDPDIGDSLEPYLMRSFGMTFAEYVDRLLLPYHRAREPGLTRESLIAESDLRRIAPYLRNATHIGVVTNRDEPILDDAELGFLSETFGERAYIYPHGGHLGNIGQHQTARDIQRFLTGERR